MQNPSANFYNIHLPMPLKIFILLGQMNCAPFHRLAISHTF
jgi:hypothetical protein